MSEIADFEFYRKRREAKRRKVEIVQFDEKIEIMFSKINGLNNYSEKLNTVKRELLDITCVLEIYKVSDELIDEFINKVIEKVLSPNLLECLKIISGTLITLQNKEPTSVLAFIRSILNNLN